MNKKLTLSLDANIVDFAHDYSKGLINPFLKSLKAILVN
jgi:hypothetical protein